MSMAVNLHALTSGCRRPLVGLGVAEGGPPWLQPRAGGRRGRAEKAGYPCRKLLDVLCRPRSPRMFPPMVELLTG
jgi:hypothetical protein